MKKILASLMLCALALGAAIPVQAAPAMVRDGSTVTLVDQSGVAASVTGTTVETTLAAVNIPGGLMGPHGAVRLTLMASMTNNANGKNIFVRYGGVAVSAPSLASAASVQQLVMIRNRGIDTSQVGNNFHGVGLSGTAALALSVDSRNDQMLTISCVLAVATDTCTLEGYTIEVVRP